MSTHPKLPDPRQYPSDIPANPLLQRLLTLLSERDLGAMVRNEAALDAALEACLSQSEDALLAEALAHAPSQAMRRVLEHRLDTVLARPQPGSGQYAIPFALPIVWVAGVRGKLTLPGRLPDIEEITALLKTHGLIAPDADIWLSARLLEREALAAIAPSQLARWRDVLQYASGGLPHEFTEAPLQVNGDGVFLRYLVGVALQKQDAPPVVQLNAPPGPWAIALAKLLGQQMHQDGLTLFPLPRAVQSWRSALADGRHAQMEIRFQVFASNILRKLRTEGETPVAIFSAHDNGEIRVTIGAEKNGENWEGFVWPLDAADPLETIQQQMIDLLRDCQHDTIRVMPEVLPTLKDRMPYFPLPIELPGTPSATH